MTDTAPEVFDKQYVSELRSESAKYRTQVRDLESQLANMSKLEAQVTSMRVENELIRRGINADPTWVSVKEGDDVATAVDKFVERWPHLNPLTVELEVDEPEQLGRRVPPAMPPNPNNANVPGPQARGSFGTRSLDEIKKDPKARTNLTDIYRDLIRTSSHQPGE